MLVPAPADLWQSYGGRESLTILNTWLFNEYFGTIHRTLYECATKSMNQEFMLKKKMSKQEILDKKNKGRKK
eukprot:g10217.t1